MPSYLSEAGRCGGLHRGRDQMLLSRDRAAKTQLHSEYDASWASEGWELRRMLWQGLTDDGVLIAYKGPRGRKSRAGHLKAAFGFLIFNPRRMLPATAGALASGASFTASRRAGCARDAGSQLLPQCLAALRGLGLYW